MKTWVSVADIEPVRTNERERTITYSVIVSARCYRCGRAVSIRQMIDVPLFYGHSFYEAIEKRVRDPECKCNIVRCPIGAAVQRGRRSGFRKAWRTMKHTVVFLTLLLIGCDDAPCNKHYTWVLPSGSYYAHCDAEKFIMRTEKLADGAHVLVHCECIVKVKAER